MRRYIIAFIVIAMMISGAGCGKQQGADNTSSDDAGVVEQEELQDGSEKAENTQTADSEYNASQQAPDSSAVIITKSDNMVSSEEKEKVLNDISMELDRILNVLNSLDDIDDEDLEF